MNCLPTVLTVAMRCPIGITVQAAVTVITAGYWFTIVITVEKHFATVITVAKQFVTKILFLKEVPLLVLPNGKIFFYKLNNKSFTLISPLSHCR